MSGLAPSDVSSPAATRFQRLFSAARSWPARHPRATPWLVMLAGLAILFVRHPEGFIRPQLWAEDASVFLLEAQEGWSAFLRPYFGYLHFGPRAIAAIAVRLDPCLWPRAFATLSVLTALGGAAYVFSSRIRLPWKPALALALVAVPHTGEVFFNATNVQWLLAVLLFQILIQDDARRPVEHATDFLLAGFAGLTGPFSVMLLPLFAIRAWMRRTRAAVLLAAVVATAAAIQLVFLFRQPDLLMPHPQPFGSALRLVAVIGRRMVWRLLVGTWLPSGEPDMLVAISSVVIAAVLFWWSIRPGPRRHMKLAAWMTMAVLLLCAQFRIRFDTWPLTDLAYGDRYFFVPRLLLLWLVLLEAAEPARRAWIARAALLLAVVMNIGSFRFASWPDLHWERYCEPIRRGEAVNAPILPPGWIFRYPGRPR